MEDGKFRSVGGSVGGMLGEVWEKLVGDWEEGCELKEERRECSLQSQHSVNPSCKQTEASGTSTNSQEGMKVIPSCGRVQAMGCRTRPNAQANSKVLK